MSLVLKSQANVEEPPLGNNAAEGPALAGRDGSTSTCRGPPRPQQPRPPNQRQHNEPTRATPNESEAPRPPNNNRGQRCRRNNNNSNKAVPAGNPANASPNVPNPRPNNRGQQRRQNNPTSAATNPANPPPGAMNTPPINPATGQPLSKRAAKRRRAQARAAEAQRQLQEGQTTTQATTQVAPQTRLTRRQRQAQAQERNTCAPTGQGSGPRQALPNTQGSNQASGSTDTDYTPDDSRLACVAQATLERLDHLSFELAFDPPVFNNNGWSDAFIINDTSAGPESEDDSNKDTEVGSPGFITIQETPAAARRPPVVTSPCSICFQVPNEYPIIGLTANCTHDSTICASCLAQHISHAVQSQGSTTLTCPNAECKQTMEYADVVRGAKDDQACLDRYEALLLRRMLEDDPKFVWCKNATCGWGQVHDSGDSAPIVICQACDTRSCFTHDVPWHTDLTCEQYTAQMENRAAEDRASQEYVQQYTKACPNKTCGRKIEKNEGCDHMTCCLPAGCGHEFCWLCFADYGPIRREGNHHHAATCRYYAAINPPDPLQAYYLRMEEIQRMRRELHAPPVRPAPPPARFAPPPANPAPLPGPSRLDHERQARVEEWLRPGRPDPVAPAQPSYRRDGGLLEPLIPLPANSIPRRAPDFLALPAPNPIRAQPAPPAPELPTPVRSWWSSVFGFGANA